MKLNAVGIICWIMIVLTTVFIVAAGVVSIISPQKDYLILGIAKMTLSLPPVWCRLMITAVSVQAVATTIIIGVDVKEQKHMKRDLVSTTLIGIVCIIFLIVPFISGFRQTVAETAVYSPKYYVFENNGRQIVIEECSGRVSGYLQSFGDVYCTEPDGSLKLRGTYTVSDGTRCNGRYKLDWSDEYVAVTYQNGSLGEETIKCYFG